MERLEIVNKDLVRVYLHRGQAVTATPGVRNQLGEGVHSKGVIVGGQGQGVLTLN